MELTDYSPMSESQRSGLDKTWLGVVAILFGILLFASYGNELLKQLVIVPGSVADLGVSADCRTDELEEEELTLQECELMVSNVQITLASSPDWFRPLLISVSLVGCFAAIFSLFIGIAIVNGNDKADSLAVLGFSVLLLLDVITFVAAVNTGPLLRAQYLWSTMLWFFIHLSLLTAVIGCWRIRHGERE